MPSCRQKWASRSRSIVIRDGEERAIDVVLGELEAYEASLADAPRTRQATDPRAAEDVQEEILLGMEIRPVNADLAREFGLDDEATGLVVTRVEPGGPADRGGVQAGDVLLHVGREAVESVQQVRDLLEAARGRNAQSVVVLIEREGNPRYLALEIGD